jgi:deazaflavin-dependent oxidoreductase (nitroreductase family)
MSARRFLYRLPLHLERRGIRAPQRWLTRLLGVDWIMLETIGRRSGRPHVVVLDVVGRDPERDTYYVQPANGRRSSWVHNVRARPAVRARIDGPWQPARVRDATGAEGADVVVRFLRDHPWYGRLIVRLVGYIDRIDRDDAALRRALLATPVFAVELTADVG